MVNPQIEKQLREQLERLPLEKQQRVVEFARSLATDGDPRLMPGSELLKLAGLIPPEDLAEMTKAIEEGCGRIDPDAW